jgi:hypothetical protein
MAVTPRSSGNGLYVRLDGAKKFRQELKRADVAVADLKEPYRLTANLVVGVAKPRTPRRTGALAGTVRGSGTQTAGIVRAGNKSVPYAGPIHWGWPARHIKPQPWLSSAAQTSEPQWLPLFMEQLDQLARSLGKDYQ